jgi:hypothetical protein
MLPRPPGGPPPPPPPGGGGGGVRGGGSGGQGRAQGRQRSDVGTARLPVSTRTLRGCLTGEGRLNKDKEPIPPALCPPYHRRPSDPDGASTVCDEMISDRGVRRATPPGPLPLPLPSGLMAPPGVAVPVLVAGGRGGASCFAALPVFGLCAVHFWPVFFWPTAPAGLCLCNV